MTLIDTLIKKAEELELQAKAEKLAQQAEVYLAKAVERTGQATHDNRDKISAFLDKAGQTLDERTEGKYHDKVAKLRTQVDKGIVKIADQRPGAAAARAAGEEPDPFATTSADPFAGEDPFAEPSDPFAESAGAVDPFAEDAQVSDPWSDAQTWADGEGAAPTPPVTHVGEEPTHPTP